MTRTFLGLCGVVFALCVISGHVGVPLFSGQFAVSTTLRFGGLAGSLGLAEPWRYLSAVFVHANLVHLAMNGIWMFSMGQLVESEVGKARFVILFVLTGVLGFVVSDVYGHFMGPPTVGASGAVFGLFGGALGSAYARRDPNWSQLLVRNLVWLLLLSFAANVNNAAHVGGFVVGALLGYAFAKESRKLKLDVPFAILAGLVLVACVGSVGLSAAAPIWRLVHADEMSRQY